MGYLNEKKAKILEKVMDKYDFTTLEKEKYIRWGLNAENLLWTIGKFIFLIYLFNKIYSRIGIDKTIIIMFVSVLITLKSSLRQMTVKPLKKKEA